MILDCSDNHIIMAFIVVSWTGTRLLLDVFCHTIRSLHTNHEVECRRCTDVKLLLLN